MEGANGERHNHGKLKWSLFDFDSFESTVRVLMFGAEKYAPNNWKQGLPTDEIIESMLRHIFAIKRGEFNDPESGLPHIGHVGCNVMFLSWMMKNRPELIVVDKDYALPPEKHYDELDAAAEENEAAAIAEQQNKLPFQEYDDLEMPEKKEVASESDPLAAFFDLSKNIVYFQGDRIESVPDVQKAISYLRELEARNDHDQVAINHWIKRVHDIGESLLDFEQPADPPGFQFGG